MNVQFGQVQGYCKDSLGTRLSACGTIQNASRHETYALNMNHSDRRGAIVGSVFVGSDRLIDFVVREEDVAMGVPNEEISMGDWAKNSPGTIDQLTEDILELSQKLND